MDLSALKTEIKCFREGVNSFITAVNANSLGFSSQEIGDLSLTIRNLSNTCEVCHNALSLLSSTESFNGNSHMAIELWNLTRAFEYMRRKYEIRVLAQKRREVNEA